MTTLAKLLNTAGLSLAAVGCILLYCFGLPPSVNPSGTSAILLERTDEAEIAKGKRYRAFGRIGIALIGVGSLIQILATWI
jgi:hypothetical protein